MQIRQFVWEIVNSNSWLIREKSYGLLIDAIDSESLYAELEDIENLAVVLTHSHFDHICGLNRIRELKPGLKVYATEQCSYNIGNKYKNMSASANAFMTFYNEAPFEGFIEPFVCQPADVIFNGRLNFKWHDHIIEVISFYGHSNDSLIAVIDSIYMFSGDSILGIPTVTRFPGGSTARFWREDIPKLEEMRVKKVYPGHGVPGDLKDMILCNKRPDKFKEGTDK